MVSGFLINPEFRNLVKTVLEAEHSVSYTTNLSGFIMLLVEFSEQTIHGYRIPAFTLSDGELVLIRFPNNPNAYEARQALKRLLSGAESAGGVILHTPLSVVADHSQLGFWQRWFPDTIEQHLKKNANPTSPYYDRIYEVHESLIPRRRINTLAGTPRRQLALFKTLSWSDKIVFSLEGVDPTGGESIFGFVQDAVSQGGAAILIDQYNEFAEKCTRVVAAISLENIAAGLDADGCILANLSSSAKVEILRSYIEGSFDDEQEWEFSRSSFIQREIERFNESDCRVFNQSIQSWDERLLCELADPILFSNNAMLDSCYLYCMIVSQTTDQEKGEYLLENFAGCFNALDPSKCTVEFLERLWDPVKQFSKAELNDSFYFTIAYKEKMAFVNSQKHIS